MNTREFRTEHSKRDMMKIIKWQESVIADLKYQMYLRDQLYNPCHESERMAHEED